MWIRTYQAAPCDSAVLSSKTPLTHLLPLQLKKQKVLDKNSELRQVKYLNNRIEQDEVNAGSAVARRSTVDHRFIKRLVKLGLGFKSFQTARRTIQGYKMMKAIRKGQINSVKKGNIINQKIFIESLFEKGI